MNHSPETPEYTLLVATAPTPDTPLTGWLRAHGYGVQYTADGASTLQLVAETHPNLILLDAQLPGIAGDEVCRRLQAAQATCDIPILWLYDGNTPLELEQGLNAGAADGLSKPLHPAEVLVRAGVHLKLHQLQTQTANLQAQITHLTQTRAEISLALQRLSTEVEQGDAERMAALRASEAMFRYFLSRALEGYVIVDEAERILYANAPARLYLGLDSEHSPQAFSTLIAQQYHREPQEAWNAWPKKTFADGVPLPLYLVRPESRTARTFWLRVTLLDVPAGMDEAAGRIIRLEDVTERTTLQDELNKFHAMISHKLRTPLVPLYSGLQYLITNIDTFSRQDIADLLQEAHAGADRLYQEIEDIVRYLNTPAHRMPPGNGCVLRDFAALVHQVAASLALHTLTVEVEASLETAQTTLSQQSLELVIWEILENAQKFHPQNTPLVTVQLRRVDDENIIIQIGDDGIHLSPEQLARMWVPYYQGDKFATGQIAGMGLGLSLVATQVWSVGGMCHAINHPEGPGIIVELVLPLQD
ncbi:MAG TPA: response regulator [Anaerolineae bacterium]|nr:response regulator [Anaerolineae bacterium]